MRAVAELKPWLGDFRCIVSVCVLAVPDHVISLK